MYYALLFEYLFDKPNVDPFYYRQSLSEKYCTTIQRVLQYSFKYIFILQSSKSKDVQRVTLVTGLGGYSYKYLNGSCQNVERSGGPAAWEIISDRYVDPDLGFADNTIT